MDPEAIAFDGDPERLHQAIVNLLDNAVRYGGGDAFVRIEVAVGSSPERRDQRRRTSIPFADGARVSNASIAPITLR